MVPSKKSSTTTPSPDGSLLENEHEPSPENDDNIVSPSFDMMKSPASLMGSSIRSNQVSSFDTEGNASNTSWRIGMPWFRTVPSTLESPKSGKVNFFGKKSNNNKMKRSSPTNNSDNIDRYYGGIMKSNSSGSSNHKNNSSNNNNNNKKKNNKNTKETSGRTTQNITDGYPVSRTRSQDSIADFNDSEWTPQDSSYGAACPVCGCVPKNVRRGIEFTMISTLVLAFVYLLVMTSINVSDIRSARNDPADDDVYFSSRANYTSGSGSNSYSKGYNQYKSALTDDDLYVEYNAEKASDDAVTANTDDDTTLNDDQYTDDYNYKNNYNGGENADQQNGGSGYYYANGYGNNANNNNANFYANYQNNNKYNYNNYNNNNGGGGRRRDRDRIRRLELRYLRGGDRSSSQDTTLSSLGMFENNTL
ncbi:hypothetical protein IV203_005116 [Nitzschia inconspicua]|uniref:Uncharacterized protein n=1 Tax=Nitzschia inconspicua TaxID=303405 RepID=A0A9K3PG21_9STRA|nr:hypothetical protein IV203_005116 [Nitzschia inconspicua]